MWDTVSQPLIYDNESPCASQKQRGRVCLEAALSFEIKHLFKIKLSQW